MARIQGLPVEILRCTVCKSGRLAERDSELTCASCQARFPVARERFPDFLTSADRERMKAELAFWESHQESDLPYEDESESSYRLLSEWIGSRPDASILEVGCGSGALLKRIAGRTRVGLEPSLPLLAHADGFHGVLAIATDLPFVDEAFDIVMFKHSLHHVEDKEKGVAEAARVLKKGGKLVIIEPNAEHPQRRLISDPDSWLRKSGVLTKFIGPVETFQSVGEVATEAKRYGLSRTRLEWLQSQYNKLTVRQALQKLYAGVGRALLPARFVYPNYYLEFTKGGA